MICPMASPIPTKNTFDHARALDSEHVGYIHMTDDGGFVPFDLLHRQCAEASELDGPIAKSVDLLSTIELALPTDRLHQSA